MVGVKVDDVELLCNPSSVAFSAADNLLVSDIAILLLVLKVSGPSNYWVNADPDIYPALGFYSPMIGRVAFKLIKSPIDPRRCVKI